MIHTVRADLACGASTERVKQTVTVRQLQTCGCTVLEGQSVCEQEHVMISCLITFASCELQFCSVRSRGGVLHCISDWSYIYWRTSLFSNQILRFKVEEENRN